jgi:small-conductance mechanosensitive channel
MFQVNSKRKRATRMQKRSARPSRKVVLLSAFAATLLAGSAVTQYVAHGQQAASASFDPAARSRDILAHLNTVIQFYRASLQPIQKAGEPNDIVYRDQAVALSSQVAGYAFQSAKAEATLMAGYQAHPGTVPGAAPGAAPSEPGTSEQQRMQTTEANVEKQISDLQAREAALDKQIDSANAKTLPGLQAQRKQTQGALDLATAMKDALQKIVGITDAQNSSGMAADIDRLQSSVPELQSKNKTAAPQITTLDAAKSSGVTSQGAVLFELFETRRALDNLVQENANLKKQALDLRTPVSNILRNLIKQGQLFSQQAEDSGDQAASTPAPTAAPPATPPVAGQPNITSITTQFKVLAAAAVPLSQEIIVLEQSSANLSAWRSSVDEEYFSILHTLLLRILVIAIALALILGGGEIWSRATNKYIRDIRRRRQFLIVRRVVVGFLSVIVILFGFVTQFNSLATFAGFITAGIAVGLQTILLSVAAYFFIIGRYGVKVGDRITISSVTGDVIDVGLVRFYMMELAGSGTELNPTGRVAVFSNAVLFQAGTPLYKQIPGTEYAWHELIVKFTDAANYKLVCEAMLKELHEVYDGYRSSIELQHRVVENWMQTSIAPPAIESRLQFNGGTFQLWARFPVLIRHASETDEKLTRALVELIATNPEIKSSVASTPLIQASIRG